MGKMLGCALLGVVLSALILAPTHGTSQSCSVDCQPLEKPRDGQVTHSSVGCGRDTATFSCNKGYRLVGSQKRTCDSREEWSGTAVRCEPDSGTCDDLGDPENGTSTTITQKVYSCLPGYRLVGEEVNTCTTGGFWAHHVPKCVPKKCCDPPEVEGASHNGTSSGKYKEGDVVGYMCAGNHTRNGRKTIECKNGEWTKPPTCDKDCKVGKWSELSECETVNGKGTQRRTRRIHHEPKGLGRKCPVLEEVFPCEETCKICVDPGQIDNGVRVGNSYEIGEKLQFSCNSGYVLTGQIVLTCQKNATYDYPKPACTECDTKLDIAFILDESGSVLKVKGFRAELEFVKRFLRDYPRKGTRVALIRYGSLTHLEFNLDTHSTQEQILAALSSIVPEDRGRTNTGGALILAAAEVFGETGPVRPISSNTTRVAVVVTDGQTNVGPVDIFLPAAAESLRQQGVRVIAVGIGKNITVNELGVIASKPSEANVFQLNDFTEFTSIVEEIRDAACGGATECPDPGLPEFATREPANPPFKVGTLLQYRCRFNYTVTVSQEQRCLANGQWLGGRARCRPVTGGRGSGTAGGWATWSSFGSCSATLCNQEGESRRTRTCTDPAPSGGGAFCVGPLEEVKKCTDPGACPPR